MACGPVSQSKSGRGPARLGDPFSFTPGGGALQGMTAMAMMWAAPWRAVAIVAEQAVRESGTPQD